MAVIQETRVRLGKHEVVAHKRLQVEDVTPLDKEKVLDTRQIVAVRTADTVDVFDKNSLFAVSSGRKNWTEWLQRYQKEEINGADLKRSYLGGRVEKSIRWEPSEAGSEAEYGATCPIPSRKDRTESPFPPRRPIKDAVGRVRRSVRSHMVLLRRDMLQSLPEAIRPKLQSLESISMTVKAMGSPRASTEEIKQRGAEMKVYGEQLISEMLAKQDSQNSLVAERKQARKEKISKVVNKIFPNRKDTN